ncbi:hypothetical protein KBW71_08240 [Hydrogenophaga aromaticivorans]|uniref:hypothetical protein n=1 Tax=Hydrogenophaga aromaticivorans TaxID=2610898 RepID=UPI001B358B2D|nr:hypothetical protein [Hydrogenophaga aromaticivorans]MBQ0918432.1 hypothetical protein [Hydrogenophaga aromaticivorans]
MPDHKPQLKRAVVGHAGQARQAIHRKSAKHVVAETEHKGKGCVKAGMPNRRQTARQILVNLFQQIVDQLGIPGVARQHGEVLQRDVDHQQQGGQKQGQWGDLVDF